MRLLIAGLTARAMAESAVRSGCDVVTVDYFGDLDTKRLAPNASLRERGAGYSAEALVRLAREFDYDAVAYTGGLENHPEAVEALASGKVLLGNTPASLRRVRDPAALFSFLSSRGFAAPATLAFDQDSTSDLPVAGNWLVKPTASGGGHGIHRWRGDRPRANHVLQEFVPGRPASAVFLADGQHAVLLGWSEQLHPPSSFRYRGNVFPFDAPGATIEELRELAAAIAARFELVGLNGIDFVLRGGRPVVVEVNPRYSASMELVERATGARTVALHVAACRGELPHPSVATARAADAAVHGKSIVYAPRSVRVTASLEWIERGVRDVPHPGEVIDQGRPICTVLATGASRHACLASLSESERAIIDACAPARSDAQRGQT